jgi:hypothetical protein
MSNEETVKNPIQPIISDINGALRFKENAIVSHILEVASRHGADLNSIAALTFTDDDRQQFAQLIGYSLDGYAELRRYVTDDAYHVASMMAHGKRSESEARIAVLEAELSAIRSGLLAPVARLYGVDPSDLLWPAKTATDGKETKLSNSRTTAGSFKVNDRVHFGRGPMEFIGTITKIDVDSDSVWCDGVETGCNVTKSRTVQIACLSNLRVIIDDTEWIQLIANEPAFH